MVNPLRPRYAPLQALAIVHLAAEMHDMDTATLRSRSRPAPIVTARHVAILALRTMPGLSLHEIGALVGLRDHTSILHAYDLYPATSYMHRDAARIRQEARSHTCPACAVPFDMRGYRQTLSSRALLETKANQPYKAATNRVSADSTCDPMILEKLMEAWTASTIGTFIEKPTWFVRKRITALIQVYKARNIEGLLRAVGATCVTPQARRARRTETVIQTILVQSSKGETSPRIAAMLGITSGSVTRHLRQLMRHYGVADRAALYVAAGISDAQPDITYARLLAALRCVARAGGVIENAAAALDVSYGIAHRRARSLYAQYGVDGWAALGTALCGLPTRAADDTADWAVVGCAITIRPPHTTSATDITRIQKALCQAASERRTIREVAATLRIHEKTCARIARTTLYPHYDATSFKELGDALLEQKVRAA